MLDSEFDKPGCFLSLPFVDEYKLSIVRDAIIKGIEVARYKIISLNDNTVYPGSSIQEAVFSALSQSDCIVADISERNPNIYYELGIAQAMGKGIILISEQGDAKKVASDFQGIRIYSYTIDPLVLLELSQKIQRALEEFQKYPHQISLSPQFQYPLPFFIDWDKLSPRDSENLCRELLLQMGFRSVEWGKEFREIDLIAEYPRKDPDGFEFRELWFISMGILSPIEWLIDMASGDLEHFLYLIMNYSEKSKDYYIYRGIESSITILFILAGKWFELNQLDKFRERFESLLMNRERYTSNIRFRIWDRNYLSSLIQRYPHLGFKYFSEEGRIRSKTRKTYEELYKENSNLSSNLAKTVADLEEEKNRRVRAERDAVWKDISFTAAHRIGNPIFAIETDLDPLLKRIRENRKQEVEVVVDNIRSSVEKAKACIEQFKSLTKAQEIKPVACFLKPILEDSCKTISIQDVECVIECSDDAMVFGDPERLRECFDELVMNATHWFDKQNKKIEIIVTNPAPEPVPEFLDTSRKYILIHFRDNGKGIDVSDKNSVFDAFFTKYEHGTGLGLALVRRIIEGHEGGILETGAPGKGADFEIYLPIPSDDFKTPSKKKALKRRNITRK
jgi:signal transduction histidine kinase